MTTRSRIGRVAALSGAVLLVAASDASAADHAYLSDRTEEVALLRFEPLEGWTEAELHGRRERAEDVEVRETRFAPKLHLGTRGSVYHEEFLVFRLQGGVRLEQLRVSGDESRSENLGVTDYDASLRLFDHKRANMLAFARDDDAWIDSPYRGSYRIRSRSEGAELRIRSDVVPLHFSYHRDRRREDFTNVERTQERDHYRATASHRAGRSTSDASVRFVQARQNVQRQDYETIGTSLAHTLQLAEDSPSHLRSRFHSFHQYGTLRRRDLGVDESLRIHAAKTIEGTAHYHFADQTGSGSGSARSLIRSHRAEAGVAHTLWGSLTTSVHAYLENQDTFDTPGSDRQRVADDRLRGGRAGIDYRRATPIGPFAMGFGLERARDEQHSRDLVRSVGNEAHVLRDGEDTLLDETRIDVTTIVVTDDTGFTVFEEGLDYTILPVGSRVLLRREPGGAIADGQSILVDYAFEFSPDLTFDTHGRRFHVRLDTSRDVSVYYRYHRAKEDYVSGVADGFLEDQRNHVAGVRFDRGPLSASEEYEVRRLVGSEFRTNRLSAGWTQTLGGSARLRIGASHSRSRFVELDRELAITTLDARLASRFAGGWQLESEATVRLDRGTPESEVPGADLTGARIQLLRRYRAIDMRLGVSFRTSNRNDVDDDRLGLFVSLRRSFRMGGAS